MSTMTIQINDAQKVFAPGATLHGVAQWDLQTDQEFVEARLIWFTRGKGTQDSAVIDAAKFDNPARLGQREFEFRLPIGPHSFSGRLISLVWAVELVTKRSTDSARQEFVLSPFGKEIELGAAE